MKDLTPSEIYKADKTKIVKQAEVKKESKLIGSMKVIPGLTLFEMDMKSGEIRKAVFKETIATFGGGGSSKLEFNPNSMYVQALNLKNAKRKFEKRVKQIIAGNE